MPKKKTTIFTSLFIIIIAIAGILFFKSDDKQMTAEKDTDKTRAESEDYLYKPEVETIAFDKETSAIFFEDLLDIYLSDAITDEEAKNIAASVDGEVVGQLAGTLNFLQLKVDGQNLVALEAHKKKLAEHAAVKYVSLSYPALTSDLANTKPYTYDNTWGDSEPVNQSQPDGFNWWAEAIKAYSAWDYLDTNDEEFEEVAVAIIENAALSQEETAKIKTMKTIMSMLRN